MREIRGLVAGTAAGRDLNLDSCRRFAISARDGRVMGRRRGGGFCVDGAAVDSVPSASSSGDSVGSSASLLISSAASMGSCVVSMAKG